MLFQVIRDVSPMLDHERAGRDASPSGGSARQPDRPAQPAKTRGYDAHKKIVGRRRDVAVDTDGRLLMVNLTTADVSDCARAQAILDAVRKRWLWLKRLFADSAYDRTRMLEGGVQGLRAEDRASDGQEDGIRGAATILDSPAHIRLDEVLAQARTRPRRLPRCVRGHDPRRHGQPTLAPDRS